MSSSGSFPDETSEVEGQGKGIAENGSLGRIRQAKEWRTLELSACLVGIPGFSIGEAPKAQVPGGRFDLQVAGQAAGAIREGEGRVGGEAAGFLLIPKRAVFPGVVS